MSSNYQGVLAVDQPLCTPISHPKLERLGQKFMHNFLREWERYLLCIQDANNFNGNNISAVSLKAAIAPDLLQSLIELQEFGEKSN